jgi:predicted RNA polymerase sigma factor
VNRVELSGEAIRLTRQLHARLPREGEVAGLLALMLLTDARRLACTDANHDLVPLADQDRRPWDASAIAEGRRILVGALASAELGKFQLQAAIAAVYDEASRAEETGPLDPAVGRLGPADRSTAASRQQPADEAENVARGLS